jgi:hypothetical protein
VGAHAVGADDFAPLATAEILGPDGVIDEVRPRNGPRQSVDIPILFRVVRIGLAIVARHVDFNALAGILIATAM